MSEDFKHERYRRYALIDSVRKHRKLRNNERAKDHSDHAVAQLQVERDVRSPVEELGTSRVEISRLNEEISLVRI